MAHDPRAGKTHNRPPISEGRFAQLMRGDPLQMYPAEAWEKFLEVLSQTANMTQAARESGINRTVAYNRKKQDPAFAELWDAARDEAFQALEGEAHERAFIGTPEPVIYQGQLMFTAVLDEDGNPVMEDYVDPKDCSIQQRVKLRPLVVHKKSDQLMMFLMTGNDKRYARKQEISGPNGAPLTLAAAVAGMTTEQLDEFIRTQQAESALPDVPDDE